jgi:cytochrome c biogenesis protein
MKNKNRIWKFFVSVKLTVFLLLMLAATSIIGTVIPQNKSPEAYFHTYGSFFYRLFDLFDIFDMYHSWWFQALLILLILNIVVCSIDRLSSTWKIIFPKERAFKLASFKKLGTQEVFASQKAPDELRNDYAAVVAKKFGPHRIEKTETGFCIFAEKWRWTRLGVYIVHLSIMFMILGAMIGSIFGFEGFVNIPEGETATHIRLRNSNALHPLNFAIRCDDFDVSFYSNGAPKEFKSSLTILENNQEVLKKDIIVNDPLHYAGINIFQSSYGEIAPEHHEHQPFSPDNIYLNFAIVSSGMVYKRKAEIGKPITIPEGKGKFVLMQFLESADFMGQNIGEALVGILTPPNGEPTQVLLPIRFANFDKMRRGAVVISVVPQHDPAAAPATRLEKKYYTGLQVTKDPGVWLVYLGFIVMIGGIVITFFMSHQRLCVEVAQKGQQSQIMVAGTANKNRLGMERKLQQIASYLSEIK